MPVFRFNKSFNMMTRGMKVLLGFEDGVVRAALPEIIRRSEAPRGNGRRDSGHEDRPVGSQGKKRELKSKRQELRRTKEALRAAEDPAERRRARIRSKLAREELFRAKMEGHAAKEQRLKDLPNRGSTLQSAGTLERGTLPDFIIIGGQKCGTTSLYRLLVRHPQVKRGAQKEIHYFDNRFDKGIEWYRQQFPSPRWTRGHKTLTGEATPAYMFLSHVPERVKETVPEARLIALLRNPVDRAYSHFHHQVRMGSETLRFEEAIRAEEARLCNRRGRKQGDESTLGSGRRPSSYLTRGIYLDQLVRWSNHFGNDRLLVIKSEDFFVRREDTLKQVLSFLELPDWVPQSWDVSNKGGYSPMDTATRQWLQVFFEPYNHRLYEYLGVDLNW